MTAEELELENAVHKYATEVHGKECQRVKLLFFRPNETLAEVLDVKVTSSESSDPAFFLLSS